MEKNPCLPGAIQYCANVTLIIQFSFYYLSRSLSYWRLKTKDNFKLLALKVVGVAYGWYFGILVALGEVDAYERWSQPVARL